MKKTNKVYLSKYWKSSYLFMLFLIALIIIGTVIFCIMYPSIENIIMIVIALSFIIMLCGIMLLPINFLCYTVTDSKEITMYSFFGKKVANVQLDTEYYYEKLCLFTAQHERNTYYYIVSNRIFDSYKTADYHKETVKGRGLYIILEKVMKSNNQIIINEETARELKLIISPIANPIIK